MMDERDYREFKFHVDTLPWQDFQMLCVHFLEDRGYTCRPVVIPGRDNARDVYGHGPNGPFISHCTTANRMSNARDKLREDVLSGVAFCREHGEEARMEIWFFSREPAFKDVGQLETYIEKNLRPKVVLADDRYNDIAYEIRVMYGDQLTREICLLGSGSLSYGQLFRECVKYRQTINTTEHGEAEFADYEARDEEATREDLIDLVSKYSRELPDGLRLELFQRVVSMVWYTVVYFPLFAQELAGRMKKREDELAHLLMPLCDIARSRDVKQDELRRFVGVLTDPSLGSDATGFGPQTMLMLRFVKHLAYHQPNIIEHTDILRFLRSKACQGPSLIDKFIVNLFYSHVCDHVILGENGLATARAVFDEQRSNYPNSTLVRLWPLMESPLSYVKDRPLDAFMEDVVSMAKTCQDSVDAKWCVQALRRCLPLYDRWDDEFDNVTVFLDLIEAVPPSIRKRSVFLLFTRLTSLLRAFLRTKQVTFLKSFEGEFVSAQVRLHQPQITHLQLEYASCIHILSQFCGREELEDLMIGRLIVRGKSPADNILLGNELLVGWDRNAPTLSLNRRRVVNWLERYLASLCKAFAVGLVERNHLKVLEFSAMRRVYAIRTLLSKPVWGSLERLTSLDFSASPSFYSKPTAVFSLIPSDEVHQQMRRVHAEEALKADEYSLMRNAATIAKCLYYSFYYGHENERDEVLKLARIMQNRSGVRVSEARYHWAFLAGIFFPTEEQERHLVDRLWVESTTCPQSIYRVSRELDGEELIIPDSILECIRSSSDKSLFAAILAADPINPEVWNLMGTTVFNNRVKNDVEILKEAGFFYALAKALARGRQDYDQKYHYNYIRSMSLAYQHSNTPPTPEFVSDVALYLTTFEARQFAHTDECVEPFLKMLELRWDSLPSEVRRSTSRRLSGIIGIKKKSKGRPLGSLLQNTLG